MESEDSESYSYKELSDPEGDPRVFEHIFTEDRPSEQISQFCLAIEKGYTTTEAAGPVEWQEPKSSPTLLNAFAELLEISKEIKKMKFAR